MCIYICGEQEKIKKQEGKKSTHKNTKVKSPQSYLYFSPNLTVCYFSFVKEWKDLKKKKNRKKNGKTLSCSSRGRW